MDVIKVEKLLQPNQYKIMVFRDSAYISLGLLNLYLHLLYRVFAVKGHKSAVKKVQAMDFFGQDQVELAHVKIDGRGAEYTDLTLVKS